RTGRAGRAKGPSTRRGASASSASMAVSKRCGARRFSSKALPLFRFGWCFDPCRSSTGRSSCRRPERALPKIGVDRTVARRTPIRWTSGAPDVGAGTSTAHARDPATQVWETPRDEGRAPPAHPSTARGRSPNRARLFTIPSGSTPLVASVFLAVEQLAVGSHGDLPVLIFKRELDLVEHLAGLLIPLDVVNVAVLHLPLDGLAHRPGQVLEPDVVASQRWQGERQRQTGCRDGDRSFHAGNLLLEIDLQTARL